MFANENNRYGLLLMREPQVLVTSKEEGGLIQRLSLRSFTMKQEEVVFNGKTSTCGSGQAEPTSTGRKAADLTAEERADINFGWKVYDLIHNLQDMLRCDRRERKQLP